MVRDWIDWLDSVMNIYISNGRSYDHIKQIGGIWSVYTSVARREMELQKNNNNNSNNDANSAIIGKEDEHIFPMTFVTDVMCYFYFIFRLL